MQAIRPVTSLVAILIALSAVAKRLEAHEFHVSLAEIEHNPLSGTLEVALNVDGEHLEHELRLQRGERVRLERTEGMDEILSGYLSRQFSLRVAGKPCEQRWVGKEVGADSTWLYFEIVLPEGSDGGLLRNSVLTALDAFASPRGPSRQINTVSFKTAAKRSALTFSGRVPERRISWPQQAPVEVATDAKPHECSHEDLDRLLDGSHEEGRASETFVAASPAAAKRLVHTFEKRHLTDRFFSEGAHYADLDRDGDLDVFSGPYWYEGPSFAERHEIFEPHVFNPQGYSNDFQSFAGDINRDDWPDVLVVEFPGARTVWYENPRGEKGRWAPHVAFDVTDNESPQFVDLTGDGHRELVFHTKGVYGYAGPDPKDPTAKWAFHPISEKVANGRFQHGLGTGDVNGDGRRDVLSKDGWLEQPESLEGDPLWKFHRFQFTGAGGADMHVYDFDGDGDGDVLTTIEAHGYGLAWYEQIGRDDKGEIQFKPHVIFGRRPADNDYGICFTQMHSVDLTDMDGDGLKDIVTGKRFWAHNGHDPEGNRPAVLYWLKTERSAAGQVRFVPYLVDDNSGVGTQVTTADLEKDGYPEIIVGNKKGTFVFLHSAREASEEEWRGAQPRTAN